MLIQVSNIEQESIKKHSDRKQKLLQVLKSLIDQEPEDDSLLYKIEHNLSQILGMNNEEKKNALKQDGTLAQFGIYYSGKLRKILKKLKLNEIKTEDIKHAIIIEAEYGCHVSAEMLLLWFCDYFERCKLKAEILENLSRSFNSVIRYSPSISLSLYYFDMAKRYLPNIIHQVYPAVLFNIGLALDENSVSEDDDIKKELKIIQSILTAYNSQATKIINELRDEKSKENIKRVSEGVYSVNKKKLETIKKNVDCFKNDCKSFSLPSTSTSMVEDSSRFVAKFESSGTIFTKLSKESMEKLRIDTKQIRKCISDGEVQSSINGFKFKDDTLIVFCKLTDPDVERDGLSILNVYRHISKPKHPPNSEKCEPKTKLVEDYCNDLLQSLEELDYDKFITTCKEMESLTIIGREKLFVADILKLLFNDRVPTLTLALQVTQLMLKLGIKYESRGIVQQTVQ